MLRPSPWFQVFSAESDACTRRRYKPLLHSCMYSRLHVTSGTGSSAIYPLLACRQRPLWRFLATEIDEKNRTYATKNIATNNLQSRIKLVDTDPTGGTLIPIQEITRIGIER